MKKRQTPHVRKGNSKQPTQQVRQLRKAASDLRRKNKALALRDKRLRSMWDSVPDGIVYRLISESGGKSYFEYVSTGFESLFELPEATVLRDATPFFEQLYPSDREEALNAQKHSAEKLTPFRYECRFNLPSGKVRWIRWHSMPERLPGGGIAWNGVALDVTTRKQAEEALHQTNEQLEHKIRERTAELEQRSIQLARLASELTLVEYRERRHIADYLHDDLQQLLVYARLQVDTLSSQPELRSSEPLAELNEALAKAIDTARNVSRNIAPPVAVARDLRDAFDWLSWDAEQRYKLNLTLRISGALDKVPEPQSVLLFTAARELLLNVFKHAGTLHAWVNLKGTSRSVLLEVRDAGRGFSPGVLSNSETRGLGLFSIRERVELLGGRFTLKTSPSRGVHVTLRIPVVAARADKDSASADSKKMTGDVSARRRKRNSGRAGRIRILFADDHRSVRESLVKLLSAEPGLEVVGQCDNGRQAVDRIERLHPDLVLMDVNMPVMDGIEATRLIKERWPAIHVVGLSMYDEAVGGRKMLRAGADAYVSKSDPADKLIKAIRKAACGRKTKKRKQSPGTAPK